MKYLIMMLVLFCANIYANTYIRVVGQGKTFDEAKNDAFKQAVQQRAGMVLLSDREAKNHDLVKREIAIYSSGYVDNFRLISQRVVNNTFEVVMDVLVSDSRISRRLFSNNTSIQQFENARHSEQINSMLTERHTGDKLLKQVLSDYPLRAYDIKQLPYQLKFDSYRNLQLFVPYEIRWNVNFLNAIQELFSYVQEGKGQLHTVAPGNIFLVTNQGYIESRQQFQFFDLIRLNAIRNHLSNENEVRLRLVIRDSNGNVIGSKCYYPNFVVGKSKPFYSLGQPNTVTFWQSEVENNHVQINLKYSGDLAKLAFFINEIDLSISSDKECGNS